MTKLNNFFQISNENIRMRRLSDWVIIVSLVATLVLVYSLHHLHQNKVEAYQDFSDLASLIDPPAGKTTRWISTGHLAILNSIWVFLILGQLKMATVSRYNFSHINNENPLANSKPLLGQYGQLGRVANLFKVWSNVSFSHSLSSHFLQGKRDGFFLECGALDGEYLSNTLLFELQLGWSVRLSVLVLFG